MNQFPLPIPHLSFSSMRCYLQDRQAFYRQYIRGIRNYISTASMVEGMLFHKIIEGYWRAMKTNELFNWEEYTKKILIELEVKVLKNEIDFLKTGSKESSEKTIVQSVAFYRECLPSYRNIVNVESTFTSEMVDLQGEILPLKLKGVLDLIIEKDDEIIMIDHKLVTNVTEQSVENPSYILQAAAYWFLIRNSIGKSPSKMIFDQVKKTKNKDGSSQLYPYVVEIKEEYLEIFLEIYNRIVGELQGKPMIDERGMVKPIPNLFAQYGWEDSWLDFKGDVSLNSANTI